MLPIWMVEVTSVPSRNNCKNFIPMNNVNLCQDVYKKTLAYELEKVKINEDGSTTHLHSDKVYLQCKIKFDLVMTTEQQLLLKDLSARLSYGVEASVRGSDEECISFEVLGIKGNLVWVRNKMLLVDHFETIEVIKPYLRPMSSMTEEENKEYHNLCYEEERECYEFGEWTTRIYFHDTIDSIDWLLSHHFDFRGLISKGLALEAPEDMYKEE